MAPVVDRLKKDYEGKVEFRIYNTEKDKQGAALFSKFGLQYVPSFVLMNSDGTESSRKVGEVAEKDLRAALDALK